jgi:hypothetical protein
VNPKGRSPAIPAPRALMAELIEARHGGYLDRLLMDRNFGSTLGAVRKASEAIREQSKDKHESVRERIESGGRKSSYAPPVNLKNDMPERNALGLDLEALRSRAVDEWDAWDGA